MEARPELHYLQHGHVNHRALQINGSYTDVCFFFSSLTWSTICVVLTFVAFLMITSYNERGHFQLYGLTKSA